MERVPLYCQGERRGEITLALWGPNGARTEIAAAMDDPGDGLYRAFLLGEQGELPLGVLAPEGGRLTVCRRVYHRDLAPLGKLLRGEARRSFRFQETGLRWRETGCPAQLFRGRFFRERLQRCGKAWWRREGSLLLLALPLEEGRPFPLETLFCLGRIETVEGQRCVVYAFRDEEPVLP
ncbi:MAG: hypothetical protein K2O45_07095 [Oscillospiraceae bacterium]|nr:hypothetical protein [Oscillospiraceae bacterium]